MMQLVENARHSNHERIHSTKCKTKYNKRGINDFLALTAYLVNLRHSFTGTNE